MKKLGKSSKKGFTLVELIVVLVILAVLAAMLVPALIGYIDRAKKEKEFQAASTVYAAVQALATEAYGKDKILYDGQGDDDDAEVYDKFTIAEVTKLTGVEVNDIYFSVREGEEAIDMYTIYTIGVQFKEGESWYTYTLQDGTWETETDDDFEKDDLEQMASGEEDTTAGG